MQTFKLPPEIVFDKPEEEQGGLQTFQLPPEISFDTPTSAGPWSSTAPLPSAAPTEKPSFNLGRGILETAVGQVGDTLKAGARIADRAERGGAILTPGDYLDPSQEQTEKSTALRESLLGALPNAVKAEDSALPSYINFSRDGISLNTRREQDALVREGKTTNLDLLNPAAELYKNQKFGYESGSQQTWEEGKTAWGEGRYIDSILNFADSGFESGVTSLPHMAAMAINMPLYIAGRTNNLAESRAKNDGREEVSDEDIQVGLGGALIVAALENYGLQNLIRISKGSGGFFKAVASGAVYEGVTEFPQEVVEYLAEQYKTKRGASFMEGLERGLQGMVGGITTGGGLAGAGYTVDATLKAVLAGQDPALAAAVNAEGALDTSDAEADYDAPLAVPPVGASPTGLRQPPRKKPAAQLAAEAAAVNSSRITGGSVVRSDSGATPLAIDNTGLDTPIVADQNVQPEPVASIELQIEAMDKGARDAVLLPVGQAAPDLPAYKYRVEELPDGSSLVIPRTPAGNAALQDILHAHSTGDPAAIQAAYGQHLGLGSEGKTAENIATTVRGPDGTVVQDVQGVGPTEQAAAENTAGVIPGATVEQRTVDAAMAERGDAVQGEFFEQPQTPAAPVGLRAPRPAGQGAAPVTVQPAPAPGTVIEPMRSTGDNAPVIAKEQLGLEGIETVEEVTERILEENSAQVMLGEESLNILAAEPTAPKGTPRRTVQEAMYNHAWFKADLLSRPLPQREPGAPGAPSRLREGAIETADNVWKTAFQALKQLTSAGYDTTGLRTVLTKYSNTKEGEEVALDEQPPSTPISDLGATPGGNSNAVPPGGWVATIDGLFTDLDTAFADIDAQEEPAAPGLNPVIAAQQAKIKAEQEAAALARMPEWKREGFAAKRTQTVAKKEGISASDLKAVAVNPEKITVADIRKVLARRNVTATKVAPSQKRGDVVEDTSDVLVAEEAATEADVVESTLDADAAEGTDVSDEAAQLERAKAAGFLTDTELSQITNRVLGLNEQIEAATGQRKAQLIQQRISENKKLTAHVTYLKSSTPEAVAAKAEEQATEGDRIAAEQQAATEKAKASAAKVVVTEKGKRRVPKELTTGEKIKAAAEKRKATEAAAAEAKRQEASLKRQGQGKRDLEKSKKPDNRDDLLTLIARLGGISRDAASSEGDIDGDALTMRGAKSDKDANYTGSGNLAVFSKEGVGYDEMLQRLQDFGVKFDTSSNAPMLINQLIAKVRDEIGKAQEERRPALEEVSGEMTDADVEAFANKFGEDVATDADEEITIPEDDEYDPFLDDRFSISQPSLFGEVKKLGDAQRGEVLARRGQASEMMYKFLTSNRARSMSADKLFPILTEGLHRLDPLLELARVLEKKAGLETVLTKLAVQSDLEQIAKRNKLPKNTVITGYHSINSDGKRIIGLANNIFPGQGYAVTDRDSDQAIVTFLHEALHAATRLNMVTDNRAAVRIESLRLRTKQALAQAGDTTKHYGLTDVDEFLAESQTNSVFQEVLSKIPVEGRKKSNVLRALVDAVARWMHGDSGLNPEQVSVMEAVIRETSAVIMSDAKYDALLDKYRQDGIIFISDRNSNDLFDKRRSKQFATILRNTPPSPSTLSQMKSLSRAVNLQAANAMNVTSRAITGKSAKEITHRAGNRSLLGLQTVDQLIRNNLEHFKTAKGNILQKYHDVIRHKTQIARKLQLKAEKLQNIWNDLEHNFSDMAQELATIMRDSTISEIHPDLAWGNPKNAHLHNAKEAVQLRVAHRELHNRFKALSPTARGIYRAVQAFHATQRNDMRRSSLARIAETWDIINVLGIAEYNKIVNATSAVDIAGIDFSKYTNSADRIKSSLEGVANLTNVRGPYFPLRRFGKYVVDGKKPPTKVPGTYASRNDAWTAARKLRAADPTILVKTRTDENTSIASQKYYNEVTEHVVEFHDDIVDADAAAARLNAEGFKSTKGTGGAAVAPSLKQDFKAPPGTNLHSMLSQAKNKFGDNSPEARALDTVFLELLVENSVRKSEMKRKKRAGVQSSQMRRGFAQQAYAGSWALAEIQTSLDVRNADKAIWDHALENNNIHAQEVVQELRLQNDPTASSSTITGADSFLSKAGFLWFLGSPSYAMVNATQVHLVATPYLAAKYGMKALPAVHKSYDKVLQAAAAEFIHIKGGVTGKTAESVVERIKQQLDPDEQLLIDTLLETGILDATFAQELYEASRSEGSSTTAKSIDRVVNIARTLPQTVELVNRVVVARATYQLAMDKNGGDVNAATKAAAEAIYETQFDYSNANKPRYFKNWPGARPIMMFKMYGQGMYSLIVTNILKSMKGGIKGAEARRTLAGLVATHSLAAGLLGGLFIEPLRWLMSIVYALWPGDDDDDPIDFDLEIEKFLADWLGSTVAEALSRGMPRLMGLDLHGRVGLNHMLWMNDRESRSYDEAYKNFLVGVLGPVGGAVGSMIRAGDYLGRGEIQKAVESFSPKLIRDVSKSYRYGDQGLKDFNGTTLAKSEEFSGWQLFLQAIGFQGADTARLWEERKFKKTRDTKLKDRRTQLMSMWRNADNKAEFWREDILPFNRAQDDRKRRITRAQLSKSSRRRRKEERKMRGGYVSRYDSINRMGDDIFRAPPPWEAVNSDRAIPVPQ